MTARRVHRIALAITLTTAFANAQSACGSQLQALDVPSGLDGALHDSVLWDRDGSGPLPAELVIGGAFRRVGGVVANGVARRDALLGWVPLGAGCDGTVLSLAIDGANRLIVGGSFATAGGVTAPRIARFDGAQWSALASPPPALTGPVTALAPRGAVELNYVENGGLGYFDGTSITGVALGAASGSFVGSATDLARLGNGDLLVAGSFGSIAGQPANNVAIYEWATGSVRDLGGGANNIVYDVELLPNGEFYAFGRFTSVAGLTAAGVARWTPANWVTYPSTMLALGVSGGGVNAAGDPVAFGVIGCTQYVAGAWQSIIANAVNTTHARAVPNGALLLGNTTSASTFAPAFGFFFAASGGTTPIGDGAVGTMQAAAELPDGSIVGYLYTLVNNTPALSNLPAPNGFVRHRNGVWTVEPTGPMPTTSVGSRAQVTAMLPQTDGGYIVAGTFTSIGGVAATGIARFDGTGWQPLGGGPGGVVQRAAQLPNGDVVVLADQSIRRFDGAQWQVIATPTTGEAVLELAACRDGSFVVARRVSVAGGVTTWLDRWVGTTRTPTLVPNAPMPLGLVELRDGAIALALATAPGTLRFDGATFQALGSLPNANVSAIAALPDGGVVANIAYGGGGAPVVRTTLRWDGVAWTALHPSGGTKPITLRDGGVLILGNATLDATTAGAVSRFATGCPSASNAVAAGCATPAGALTSDAPWLGQTLRLQASGLPNAAFAIAVGSTQAANLPLASVFATALPGCALLVQPDVTSVQLAVAGKAQLALAIPNTAALVGATFGQQFVSFALDPSLAVGATNALQLAVGSY